MADSKKPGKVGASKGPKTAKRGGTKPRVTAKTALTAKAPSQGVQAERVARIIAGDEDLHEGVRALRRTCAVMRKVHDAAGHPPLRRRDAGFEGLARIVVGQQVSVASANAIWGRTFAAVQPFTPERLLLMEDADLAKAGLMAGDRVKTDWNTMRTADPKVFAAGDGAFGGSTIVMAMMHGHRAAHYVKSQLDGIADPLPYRTPYRTRRVEAAQDINWELFPRRDQKFNGLGANPSAFPEIETTYNDVTAKEEASRCYRCDAETGSSDYSVKTREDIFVMARTPVSDLRTQAAILEKRLTPKANPFPEGHHASFEDLVLLPANRASRLNPTEALRYE